MCWDLTTLIANKALLIAFAIFVPFQLKTISDGSGFRRKYKTQSVDEDALGRH